MVARPKGADDDGEEWLVPFALFCLLFGQPAAVFALAVASLTRPVLAVGTGGTVLLAAAATRAFRAQGRSADRLVDFVLVLAGTQIVLALAIQLLLAVFDPAGGTWAMTRPAIVVLGYPVAYYVVYRSGPVSVSSLGLREE